MLTKYKNHISQIMPKIGFDESAQQTFLASIKKVSENEKAAALFLELLERYEKDYLTPFPALLEDAAAAAKECGVHEYTMYTLLLLCMSQNLKRLYDERKIPENVFYDSLCDLTYKLNECRIMYKIDGTFVASWFRHLFTLELFALGRLQFELFRTRYEYTFRGKFYPVGSKLINIHIPRTGTSLSHDEVLASYRQAEKVFSSKFPKGPLLFLCDSWLLDPWIPTVLRPDANLTAFQNDFEIVKTGECYEYSALWTVFDKAYDGDISALPADTTLRRAYIERIKKNEPFYYGHGMFFYENGEILK